MFKQFAETHRTRRKGAKRARTHMPPSLRVLRVLAAMVCTLVVLATACAPARQPTPTPAPTPARTAAPTKTPVPTAEPTWTPAPVPTPAPTGPEPQVGAVEGLVMSDNGQIIIGVNWTSKSRITYVVQGDDPGTVLRFLGETARVTGVIVDRGPWLKEILVRAAEASTATDRLSMRTGFIKELGASIYMQGTHLLTDREGKTICLLGAQESGLDLDSYMLKGKATVTGVMTKTVEGNAQIMEVKLVEPAK